MGWARDAAALLPVLLAVLAAFPRALSPDWAFFQRDIHAYWYPMVATFVRVVARGQVPLWDPYEGYGLPLWADPGSQAAYPATWLNLILAPHVVYKLIVLGHALLAAAGTFVLVRRWQAGRLPAAAAAAAYACSGPFVSAATLVHHYCGAAWIPWALAALEGLLASGSRRAVAGLALALGGLALAGSAEMCAVGGLALLLRGLAFLAEHRGRALRRAGALAAAGGAGFLLAAVQWIPTAAILGHSSRAHFTAEQRLSWSVHPWTLGDLAVPRLASEVAMGPGRRGTLYDGREPFLTSIYLGAGTLPLALFALRSRRRARAWVIAGFALFLALSLGRHLLLARAVLGLPPLSLFRYPSKYLLPTALFWSLLVGLGLDAWRRTWDRADRRLGIVLGVGLTLASLGLAVAAHRLLASPGAWLDAFEVQEPFRAWMAFLAALKLRAAAWTVAGAGALLLWRAWRPEWARVAAALAAVLAIVDLARAARPVNPLAPVALLLHRPPLLQHMQPLDESARVLSVGGLQDRLLRELTRGPAGWEPEWRWTLGAVETIAAPSGSRWGLRGSYDADFTGLAPVSLPALSALVRQAENGALGLRLLQMGGVHWVIDQRAEAYPALPVQAEAPSVFTSPLRLLRVPDPLPHCHVVGGWSHAPDDDAAIARLSSPAFDPGREAVVAGAGSNVAAPAGWTGQARFLAREANAAVVETDTSGPGLLVVLDAFHPGWTARLDGREVPLERANVLFRGVSVPAGRHRVALEYRPRSVWLGLALGAVGLVLVGALLLPRRRAA